MARILVIDDDQDSRFLMGAILENAAHEVAYAANGEQGLEVYSKSPFDLVIVDLVMPIKNGFRTIRELVEKYHHRRILAISGISPEQLDVAQKYGAMRTMVKPIEPEQLLEAVDGMLRRSIGWDGVTD